MHVPRKRFGQHFLSDEQVIGQILAVIAPNAHDHLVEIGPGLGALTFPLLKKVNRLEVIELDRDLIPTLQTKAHTQSSNELEIYSEDALTFDFASLKKDKRLLRIIGNLPYNISTPLLFHLLEFASCISDMTFMLQKEVAERIAAHTNTSAYGRLSVMMQYHCKVELLFDVGADAFYPPPKVQSSILRLIPYSIYPHIANHYDVFESLVKQAFGQRRKTLRNSLKNKIKAHQWEALAISSTLRPEDLSVKEFVELANVIDQ